MKKTILILDDDATTRELMVNLVQQLGYNAFAFERKSDAYHCAVNDQPELIISDIRSPEMGGFGFLKLLRGNKSTQDIPVIIVSGNADEAEEEAMRLGANAAFKKPFADSALEKKIKELMRKA